MTHPVFRRAFIRWAPWRARLTSWGAPIPGFMWSKPGNR
jgi:hypothetical protein